MSRIKWVMAVLLGSILCVTAQAQDQTNLIQQVTIRVKPGMNQQFMQAFRQVVNAARETESTRIWRTAQSVSGDQVYIVTRVFDNWEEFGSPGGGGMVETYGEDEAQRIGRQIGESIESATSAFYTGRGDLGYPPTDLDSPPQAIVVNYLTINQGMMGAYIEFAAKMREASMTVEPGAYFVVAVPDFGADRVMTTVILPTWGDLDNELTPLPQRLIQHFGQEEGGALLSQAGEIFGGTEAIVYRTRPDLTYVGSAD